MNNRRIWFRLGGVLAAAAVCTGGAAVVSDRAQEAKNVQRAFLGAMETQMQIGCYPSETDSPADLTERALHYAASGPFLSLVVIVIRILLRCCIRCRVSAR